jgi:hypothetical protein
MYNEKRINDGFLEKEPDRTEPQGFSLDRPTTEDYENKKKTLVKEIFQTLVENYPPEDIFDIFNEVRQHLEEHKNMKLDELGCELNSKTEYFNALKNIRY